MTHLGVLEILAGLVCLFVPGDQVPLGFQDYQEYRLSLGAQADLGMLPTLAFACETCSRPFSLGRRNMG